MRQRDPTPAKLQPLQLTRVLSIHCWAELGWLARLPQMRDATSPHWPQNVVATYTASPGLTVLGASGSTGAICMFSAAGATCTFPTVAPAPGRRRLAAAGEAWMQVRLLSVPAFSCLYRVI